MLITALLLLTLTALLGLYLLSFILQNKNTPKGVAFTHGSLAAIGLFILIIYAFIHDPSPILSITIFVIAAVGGFMLILRDLTGKSVPKWMAIAHGLLAITAFIILLHFIFFKAGYFN